MNVTRFVVFVSVVLLSVASFTQEAQKSSAGQSAAKPSGQGKAKAGGMSMKAPSSPEMDKLAKTMVGTWTTAETVPPSQMMPNGGTGSGEAIIHRGPGGNSLLQNYRSQSAMGKFAGHGITWYDPQAKAFKNIWCDTMTPGGCEVFNGTGQWEGDKLVFTGTQNMMGKTEQVKETMSDITPDSFTFTIESGPDANSMKNFMTIKYTRKAGAMGAHDMHGMHGDQQETPPKQ